MRQEDADKIISAFYALSARHYELRADHDALLRTLAEVLSSAPPIDSDQVAKIYRKKQSEELERVLLSLGDTHPGVYDALRALLGR